MIPRLPLADVAWIARMMLGLTFLASGVAKVRDIDGVVVGVLRYEIGPPRVMRRLAPLLPAAELVLAVLLLSGLALRWAAVGTMLMAAVFATAVAVNLRRDRPIACHCYGTSPDERIGRVTLVRLLVLGAAAALVFREAPAGGVLVPSTASAGDTLRLAGIAAYAAGTLRMLGPAAMLWRDLTSARHGRRRTRSQSPVTRLRALAMNGAGGRGPGPR